MHPLLADVVAWTIWAPKAYATIQGEREQDRREEACLSDLAKKGVIRIP